MNTELKQLRLDKGYTLKRLAKLSGLSKTYLNSIETGFQTNPSLTTIDKIATGLNEDLVKIYYIIKNMSKS